MAIRAQSAKAKGWKLQQDVCKAILSAFPSIEPDDVADRKSLNFHIECKARSRTATAYQVYGKAKRRIGMPIAILKADYGDRLVAISLDDFMALVKAAANDQ